MEQYNIIVSKRARKDLRGIRDSVTTVSMSPLSTTRTLDKIVGTINKLDVAPERGRILGQTKSGNNVRTLKANKSYTLLFTVNNHRRIVRVNRVLYARRNITMHDIKD